MFNKSFHRCAVFLLVTLLTGLADSLKVVSFDRQGALVVTNSFTNGILAVERTDKVSAPPQPYQYNYTTGTSAQVQVHLTNAAGFFRPTALDLSGGRNGFSNLISAYSMLATLAGAGGASGIINKWQANFENGPATNALLSRPHIALSDEAGNIYIADKEGHAIRKVRRDGTIVTVAGTSVAGNGPDTPAPGTQVMLNQPNGLWVRGDGTLYILDLANRKIRRLDTNSLMTTFFAVPGLISGRGLWVKDDESLAYVSSGTVVKRWTRAGGVSDYATGFRDLGNLALDPAGQLVVTDRGAHRVYRLFPDGSARTVIAGNGTSVGGGDGLAALDTGLDQVRGIWFLPTGAYFLATENGSQVWYVDATGLIHLFLHGRPASTSHSGDGAYFYNPTQASLSKVRSVTMDRERNLLITENDAGYVRRVRFLRSR